MAANLEAGRIAGYCVGAPWGQAAVAAGLGRIVMTGYELWNNAPEKVLGVTRSWAEYYPNTHRALLRALVRACQWLDEPANRASIAPRLAASDYVDADAGMLDDILAGRIRYHSAAEPELRPDYCVFHRYAANFPWRSHALWFLEQMIRWGQLEPGTDIRAVAAAVYQCDLYREVAADVGAPAPVVDHKVEGHHGEGWTLGDGPAALSLGADRFFDGGVFDPADLEQATRGAVGRVRGRSSDVFSAGYT